MCSHMAGPTGTTGTIVWIVETRGGSDVTRCIRCGKNFTIPMGRTSVNLPTEAYCVDCLIEMSTDDKEWEKARNEWYDRTGHKQNI